MALSLKDADTDRLAWEVARLALAERLVRERCKRGEAAGLAGRLDALARDGAALPDLDGRRAEEIIGYDAQGVPR